MFNQNQWHAEKATFRAVTGGVYRLLGPYGTIISGNNFPAKGTIPLSSPKAGTILSTGVMVRGTGTSFLTDVQQEDYIHANNVVRKVRHVMSNELLELEAAFPSNISTAHGLRVCRPQIYNAIYAKNTGGAAAAAMQEAPFAQDDVLLNGGAPISFDATGSQIDFTLSQ